MTMDGTNLFGFHGNPSRATDTENKNASTKQSKPKAETKVKLENERSAQASEIVSTYGSDPKAKQPTKKKQVETPAFGKKDKGFFKDNQASPAKLVSQFSLVAPTKKETPSSNKSNKKKILSKSAAQGEESVHSSRKSLQTIGNSGRSSRQSLANPTNVQSTKKVVAEKLKNKR